MYNLLPNSEYRDDLSAVMQCRARVKSTTRSGRLGEVRAVDAYSGRHQIRRSVSLVLHRARKCREARFRFSILQDYLHFVIVLLKVEVVEEALP